MSIAEEIKTRMAALEAENQKKSARNRRLEKLR